MEIIMPHSGQIQPAMPKRLEHEYQIVDSCLAGKATPERIERFYRYTVSDADYREYRWTWCGRYCVPLGLATAIRLSDLSKGSSLRGNWFILN